jgi:Ca-activated chloride channel homolog
MTNTDARGAICLSLLLAFGFGCPAGGGDDDDAWYDESGEGDDDDDDDDDDDCGPTPGDDDDSTSPSGVSDGTPPPDGEDDLCEDAPTEPVTFWVSADDSNSMAQPAMIRSRILSNSWSYDMTVRPYEFLNYYDFDFGPSDALRIVPQLRETDDGLSLLVAVVAPDKALDARRPLNLTFSLDLSCSMQGEGINGMKNALSAIAAELRAGDLVSAVEWADTQAVLLDNLPVTGPDEPALLALIDGLDSGGGTNLAAGLNAAYSVANQNASPTTLDRVVLISDGYANLGVTSASMIATAATDSEADGIYLAAIGTGDVSDSMLDEISDEGRGSYLIVDSPAEAQRTLRGDAFLAALDLSAREVELELTLPEGLVIDEFAGEQISENQDDVWPQHLAPNSQMLYSFQLVDCAEEEELDDRQIGLRVQWLEPFTGGVQETELSVRLSELISGPTNHVLKADAIVRYARLMGQQPLDPALIPEVRLALPADPDLEEIEQLLTQVGLL